jgi:hypothetical protein
VSAVIYAAIVVLWAVVLVPMWLRRHDTTTESRSVDRFSTAMRTLSRRSGGPDRREIVMPRRDDTLSVHVSGAAATRKQREARPVRPSVPSRPMAPAARAGRSSLVARRRRMFVGLSAVTGLTFVLAVAGVVSWPLQIVVDVALIGFVVHLRAQAKRAPSLRVVARPAPAVAEAPAAAAPAERVGAVRYDVVGTSRQDSWDPAGHVAAVDPDGEALPEPTEVPEPVAAEATGTDGGRSTWEPIPVPPPTYTMKPTAPPRSRPSVPVMDDEELLPAVDEAPELDEILARRRAVND